MLSDNQIYKDLRDLEEKQFTINHCGEILGSDACNMVISVSLIEAKENEKVKEICSYKALNIYASLIFQHKIAQILSQQNTQKLNYIFSKETQECKSNQKGIDYTVHITPTSQELNKKLNEIVKNCNKNAIKSTKSLVNERKKELESKKIAEDTLMYFINKSQKFAVKEFEKTF